MTRTDDPDQTANASRDHDLPPPAQQEAGSKQPSMQIYQTQQAGVIGKSWRDKGAASEKCSAVKASEQTRPRGKARHADGSLSCGFAS